MYYTNLVLLVYQTTIYMYVHIHVCTHTCMCMCVGFAALLFVDGHLPLQVNMVALLGMTVPSCMYYTNLIFLVYQTTVCMYVHVCKVPENFIFPVTPLKD